MAAVRDADGGGIFLYDGGDIQIRGSMLQGNYAIDKGGAIYIRQPVDTYRYISEVSLSRSLITGNTAGYGGGGIYAEDYGASIVLQECLVAGNYAKEEGG
eukprot:gene30376-37960_t